MSDASHPSGGVTSASAFLNSQHNSVQDGGCRGQTHVQNPGMQDPSMADSPADSKPAQDTNALLQQLVSLAKVLTSTTQAISGRVTTIEQLLQQAQHNNTQQAAPSPGAAPTAPTSGISRTQLPRSKNVPQFLGTNTSVPAPPGPPAMSKAKREAEKSTDMLLLADGASVSPAGQKSKLQVSIDRAIKGNLSYPQMAVQLLQRLCTRRGIRNMSTQKSSTILADNLTALDRAMNRSSPFIDDFHAIAQGAAATIVDVSGENDPQIPPEVVLALRGVLKSRPRQPSKTMIYSGRKYRQADVLDIIDAEDRREASTDGVGSDEPSGDRKTMHCAHRLLSCMILDKHRHDMIRGREKATRAELDAGYVRAEHRSWRRLHKTFTDPTRKLPRVTTHVFAEDTDPNILSQPNITTSELKTMFEDIRDKFGPCYDRRTSSELGARTPWEDLCEGDTDVFLMGEAMFMYPELLPIVDTLMPEDVRREDDGTNDPYTLVGDSASPTGASRRAQAKRRGVELYNNRRDQAKARKLSRAREAEDMAERCTERALSNVSATLGTPPNNMNSEWRSKTDEAECVSARLCLRLEQTRAYEKFTAELDKQAETDPEGNGFMSRFLKRQLKNLEDTMLHPDNAGDGGGVGVRPGSGAGVGSDAGGHTFR